MEKPGEFKIRTLPRGGEAKKASAAAPPKPTPHEGGWRRAHDSILYGALVVCVLALLSLHDFSPTRVATGKITGGQYDISSFKPSKAIPQTADSRINESISRHMQDAELQSEMLMRAREIENERFRTASLEPNLQQITTLPDTKEFGVRFDSDESVERINEDLNPDFTPSMATLPVDRINSRLANRKWVNQMERAEKIQFLTAFVRSAYEHGYEVEIDANLIVVGVKRVDNTRTLNINQVIDRLAKGQ